MQKQNKKRTPQKSFSAQKQTQQQLVAMEQQFHGPIPPPEILAGYERLLSGAADRIIAMAESETVHRQGMEKIALEAEIGGLKAEAKDTRRGQYCGLLIGVVAIVAGVVTAINGYPLTGGFFGTGAVLGLVSVFIGGRSSARHNEKKTQPDNK